MKLIPFPEVNVVFAKDQPEYLQLPAHVATNPERTMTCCWQLSWRERIVLLFTGRIWHQVWTFGESLQPLLLHVVKPKL